MIMEKQRLEDHGFPPVIHPESQILILGSFPSVKSREETFYYMHPRNRFWPMLASLYEDRRFLSPDVAEKKKALQVHRIALYDAVEACRIEGSKDASITGERPTDVKALIAGTAIQKIVLNGKKAASIFKAHNPEFIHMCHVMPSTSPANASYRLEDLMAHWSEVL
ncbi:MAG: DNA-deoxyinosine glycosylase, partial [Candidatus Izemoplasmataceae bacterium]